MVEAAAPSPIPSLAGDPPGPRGYPLLGILPKIWRDPLRFFLDAAIDHGDVVCMGARSRRFFLLSNPDHIQYVLQDNARNYWKGRGMKIAAPLMGEGLATSEGELWRRQRRLMQPHFSPQRIAALAPLMTAAAEEMLGGWREAAASARPIDVNLEMNRLTQTIIVRTMLGTEVGEDGERLYHACHDAQEHINRRAWSLLPIPASLPTPGNLRFRRSLRLLDGVVYRMIDERRRGGGGRGDLLSALLEARSEEDGSGMSDRQLRDEVLTIFFAGHDTTASTLAWTWYLLSSHPEVERRLAEEALAALGGRTPEVSDLASLPYARMVVQESMRLYPPGWIIARTSFGEDRIGGYTIPANATILLMPYVTHRHPRFWEDPEAFDPERFSPERQAGRPRFAYFPFGGGPRQCIGNVFAMVELQLVVPLIAQAYRLELVPGQTIRPLPLTTLRPRDAIWMRLSPRRSG